MPFIALRHGVGFCDYHDRMLVLDVNRDRYFELTPHLAQALRNWADGILIGSSEIEGLNRAGLFVSVDQPPSISRDQTLPIRYCIVGDEGSHPTTIKFLVEYAAAIFWLSFFHWAIKRFALRTLLNVAEAPARSPVSQTAKHSRRMMNALAAFYRATLLFPRASRCLPDALALQRFITRRGVSSKIIFGVQTDPFQAHCWVQHDDAVLCQSLETVTGFRVILVMR
ncbi:lasso peptide biosynthesis B2 protein [Sphingobium sp. SYK-6]|uniref:lasso peptide biosynthesis B2 protein n=1 Tax=Sphingobium sp. (strain NBRC 103272 / SYK-6) TaxID=627192 RepID=UPI000A0481D1|nr:lasso peptide biosynthesis B2 protein [Sphingobium sp. SYK-6]